VHGDPLPSVAAGAQPEPETEEVADDRVQINRTVRLGPVQENRDRNDGNVSHQAERQQLSAQGQIENALNQWISSNCNIERSWQLYPDV
jgi:hypothetical protein